MHGLLFTAEAVQDMRDVWQYIANDNFAAADRMIDQIESLCLDLQQQPYLGRAREELMPGARTRSVGSYLVVYRVDADDIQILRVLHGARDLQTLF